MAEDTRSHLDYYINVCRGYFPGDAKAQCQGMGGIGGCQVDNKAVKAYNMGYVVNPPTVSSKGHVTLRYINGDICHKTHRRSTRINFFCSDVHVRITMLFYYVCPILLLVHVNKWISYDYVYVYV